MKESDFFVTDQSISDPVIIGCIVLGSFSFSVILSGAKNLEAAQYSEATEILRFAQDDYD